MKFTDLRLGESLLKAIEECGYNTPTPIQEQAIPVVLEGGDLLGSAQTGSGKTAGFALPLIELLGRSRSRARMPRALILEPTRELAAQVLEDFIQYGKYHPLNQTLITGGVKPEQQQRALAGHVDIIIATPGRFLDMFERGRLLLTDIRHLVIDEADRMLDMGFIPDVERIVSLLSPRRQTLFFSATFEKQVLAIAKKFLNSPKVINVAPPSTASATVEHRLLRASKARKMAMLIDVIHQVRSPAGGSASGSGGSGSGRGSGGSASDGSDGSAEGGMAEGGSVEGDSAEGVSAERGFNQAIIFCNRKRDIQPLVAGLTRAKMGVAALHGDINQSQRTETLAAFKAGKTDILIASDVAARGLDIETVSHVFNYDVPQTVEDYIHRIGRTGRAGRSGIAITLATDAEQEQLDAITKQLAKSGKSFQAQGDGGRDSGRGEAGDGYRGGDSRRGGGGRDRRGGRADGGEGRGSRRDRDSGRGRDARRGSSGGAGRSEGRGSYRGRDRDRGEAGGSYGDRDRNGGNRAGEGSYRGRDRDSGRDRRGGDRDARRGGDRDARRGSSGGAGRGEGRGSSYRGRDRDSGRDESGGRYSGGDRDTHRGRGEGTGEERRTGRGGDRDAHRNGGSHRDRDSSRGRDARRGEDRDRGGDRDAHRGADRGRGEGTGEGRRTGRGEDRDARRNGGSRRDRDSNRGRDARRGGDRDRGEDRGGDRNAHRGADRGNYTGKDTHTDRGDGKNTHRGEDRNRNSDRGEAVRKAPPSTEPITPPPAEEASGFTDGNTPDFLKANPTQSSGGKQ